MFSTSRLLEKIAKVRHAYDATGSYVGDYDSTGTLQVKRSGATSTESVGSGVARSASNLGDMIRSAKSTAKDAAENVANSSGQATSKLKAQLRGDRRNGITAEIKRRSGGNVALEARWHKQWMGKRQNKSDKSTTASRASAMLKNTQKAAPSSSSVKRDIESRGTGISPALKQKILRDALKGN